MAHIGEHRAYYRDHPPPTPKSAASEHALRAFYQGD
jgi:hypothetical protein